MAPHPLRLPLLSSLRFRICLRHPPCFLSTLPLTYTENDGPIPVDSAASIQDSDSPTLPGGILTISLAGNTNPEETLTLETGTQFTGVTVTRTNNDFSTDNVLSATLTTETNDTLRFSLTDASQPIHAAYLLRALRYTHPSDNPTGGVRTVTITLDDGRDGVSLPTTRTIDVIPVDDPPIAVDNLASTIKNTSLVLSHLLDNDSDPDDTDLTLSLPLTISSQGGALSQSGNTVTYSPASDFTGTDTFTYDITSGPGAGLMSTATVTVTVQSLDNFTLAIDSIAIEPDLSATLKTQDAPSRTFTIQRSDALKGGGLTDWTPIGISTTRPDGTFEFLDDTPSPFPAYFYRIHANE